MELSVQEKKYTYLFWDEEKNLWVRASKHDEHQSWLNSIYLKQGRWDEAERPEVQVTETRSKVEKLRIQRREAIWST